MAGGKVRGLSIWWAVCCGITGEKFRVEPIFMASSICCIWAGLASDVGVEVR